MSLEPTFELEPHGQVGIIFIDQPGSRYNTLTKHALREFAALLERLERDPTLTSGLLMSRKGDSFVVGADIAEFDTLTSPAEAQALIKEGQALFERLERSAKPVACAVHGAALGGGLELALACAYRVATHHPKTHFALPEVTLGLCPGLGGTQRLPALVGLEAGLELCLTGRNVYAKEALRLGLVDALTHQPGLLEAGLKAASGLADGTLERKAPQRKGLKGWRSTLLERTPLTRVVYTQALERAEKKTRGNYPAPAKIVEVVRTGQEDGAEAGYKAEAEGFSELLFTPEAKALRHLFFAKRACEKSPYPDAAREVSQIGVVGAGLMGAGIAHVSAERGFRVRLKDQTLALAARGKGNIWKSISKRVGKGRSAFERDLIDSLITPVAQMEALAEAQMVVEAVLEDLALKQQVVREVEAVTSAQTILASNTSSIPIRDIAAAATRPEQVLGMHYFSPVPKLPLLEIVATPQNPDWVVATAFEVGRRQGKTPIIVGDGPGFYTTRLVALYINEALLLLEEGAPLREVDRAAQDLGFPVGPITLIDEVGIDVGVKINKVLGEHLGARGVRFSTLGDKMVAAGFLGRKSGKGFYLYSGSSGEKERNDALPDILGQVRREVPRSETRARLELIMVAEAIRCLEEGVLRSARDGDVGAVFGLGFPPFLGGPFFYTDRLGANVTLLRLEALEQQHGASFAPPQLLREHAAAQKPFYA